MISIKLSYQNFDVIRKTIISQGDKDLSPSDIVRLDYMKYCLRGLTYYEILLLLETMSFNVVSDIANIRELEDLIKPER